MHKFDKIYLLGVGFTNASEREVLEFINTGLEKKEKKYYIVTPNPELLVIANDNKDYKRVLNNAKLALADGVGVTIATRLMGKSLKQRITGVDLVESMCKYFAEKPVIVSFLGAGPGVAENAADCLRKKYTGLNIGWFSQEYDEDLEKKKTDILFVAFGSPKQELWISNNFEKINAKVIVGVGGAFDFISNKVPRAPLLLRKLGLEWLFRLIIQPWRFRRQLSLIKFIYLVLKERLTGSSS
jgi:N-acetylglucosaminyldiphosphoundecaprenol N-acetyl-beta-D-mannosaminyltransferase